MHQANDHTTLVLAIIAFSVVAVSTTYFLPAIVAFWRGHYRRWTILFLNVILGWTGVVWLYLLLIALEIL